jgi:hypothetical protein
LITLLPLGLALVGSAQAAGLTTVFDTSQSTFVNTNPSETPAPGVFINCVPFAREVACLDGFNDNGFVLAGSGGGSPSPDANTTTFTLVRNSNSFLPLSFKWNFKSKLI